MRAAPVRNTAHIQDQVIALKKLDPTRDMSTMTATGNIDSEQRRILTAVAAVPGGIHYSAILKAAGIENSKTYRLAHSLQRRGLLSSTLEERYPGKLQRYWYITQPGIEIMEIRRDRTGGESGS